MPTDTTVKFFHSAMAGSPVLSGTAGALKAVLDACLVNGFGSASVTSLVVSGGVATATIAGGHGAESDAVVLIGGALPGGLNGEKKVLGVGSGNTTLTFDATGIADQTATGTITCKMAPAGWEKTYDGTNLAAYKSASVAATQCLLRLDDSAGKIARVVGYGSMTGIGAGTGPFPTGAQRPGGSYWTKSASADASARAWSLVADDRFFVLRVDYNGTPLGGAVVAFGDFVSTRSGDAWGCVLTGYPSDKSGVAPGDGNDLGVLSRAAEELYFARSYTALGGAAQGYKAFPLTYPATTVGFNSGNAGAPYPNPPDQGLYVAPHYLLEAFLNALRGTSPGLWASPQTLPVGIFQANAKIAGAQNLLGRTLLALPFGSGVSPGYLFADVTGPWR